MEENETKEGNVSQEMKEQAPKQIPYVEEITTLGINEHIEGALCYLLFLFSGLLFLIIERHNKFVRFHAIQSIATFLPLLVFVWVIEKVLSFPTVYATFTVSILGIVISIVLLSAIWTLILALWVLLIYKASRGEKYKVPIAGRFAERHA